MYYIVHAFLALKYKIRLREGVRGVHAITMNAILYYLVKTKKLAQHLYDGYVAAYEETATLQKVDDFQGKAYAYALRYDSCRNKREIFTYNVNISVEEFHSKKAIDIAEDFVSIIRQIIAA